MSFINSRKELNLFFDTQIENIKKKQDEIDYLNFDICLGEIFISEHLVDFIKGHLPYAKSEENNADISFKIENQEMTILFFGIKPDRALQLLEGIKIIAGEVYESERT
jgi:hypothetical protein